MATVFLGLGSNLGRREDHLRRALAALGRRLEIAATSPVYETRAMYVTGQPRFLNMVARVETRMAPRPLMAWLKRLEATLGRTPGVRFGPRAIDLDILSYDRTVMRTPDLTIPHPRLAERAFVLRPLADLAPDWVHPTTGRRAGDMLAALGARQGISLKHRSLDWRAARTD